MQLIVCKNAFFALVASTCVLFAAPAQAQVSTPTAPLTSEQLLAKLDPDMRSVVVLYDNIRGLQLDQLNPQDARSNLRRRMPPRCWPAAAARHPGRHSSARW